MAKLVEVFTDCKFDILEDTHGKPLRVGGEMQLEGVKNANGRIYSGELWDHVMASPKLQSRLRERKMVGELDHPASGKTSVRNISHVMTQLEMRESKRFPGHRAVYGVYECVPTPDGKILETLHRSRIGVDVSSRGDGDLEERGGDSYVIPSSYELDTFDAVMDPSVNVSVAVLESLSPGSPAGTPACTLRKALGAKAVENLVRAIFGIVESGNFDQDAARYYRTILESVQKDDSETYLMATHALKELTEHLEVTKVNKPAGLVSESSQPSGLTEHQIQAVINENTELKKNLEDSQKRAEAGQRLCQELLIQSRALKMQNESLLGKMNNFTTLSERYQSAKVVIRNLREQVATLAHEGKLRVAAERLLGAFLSKLDETKRNAYIERVLANESKETRDGLRSVLLECDSKSSINKVLRAFKSTLKESRTSRGLPPVTESGARSPRIPRVSPLLEENQGPRTTPAPNSKLQEQVDFTKRLVRVTHGEQQRPSA